jgi:SOS-response transcriptional repressors (RecA-mediated autopeptidases)
MGKIDLFKIKEKHDLDISLIDNRVQAGFPSPAQGINSDSIDLNKELIKYPSATFCAKVSGDSMIGCGINDGDLLIVDKSITPQDGCIAVCFIDGEFTVKKLSIKADGIYLVPANSRYPLIHIPEDANFQVWGIVSYVIKKTAP